MDDFWVAEISLAKALELNENLIDDDKVAFEVGSNPTERKYIVKLKFAEQNTNLISKGDIISEINLSQEEVDGTLPVVKRLRVYP